MNNPKVAVVFELDAGKITASTPAALGQLMKEQYDSQKDHAAYIRWEVKRPK